MNQLPYWDPVTNICLGVLHNWYEGVLQHHFRYRWGFDSEVIKNKAKNSEVSDSGSDILIEDNLQSENEDSFDIRCYLPQEVINRLKKRLNEVVVPEGICCIPVGIGTASNGKLKENEWLVLFSIYLPLTILDIFWDSGPKTHLLLIKISALIQYTQIVEGQSVTQEDGQLVSQDYNTYQTTSNVLFPNVRTTPNHHYAMHMPKQLSRWGPLNGISEYDGERLVGILQKLKSNSLNGASTRIDKYFPKTLLCCFCEILGSSEQTIMKKFGQLQRLQKLDPQLHLTPSRKSRSSCRKQKILDDVSYIQILNQLQRSQPMLCDYQKLLHPCGSVVLRCFATEHLCLSWHFGLKFLDNPPPQHYLR
ncbi:hypothetical protein O181_056147 [Austropuccinia psidii MF-1]|uniref:Uncharacterized protein n=1 Tax=Austropuccinia psidii MF-1 TaxID=1389203 RepID=A0A9Q3HU63_9BASI|nr:hypothetical protein [Austropuccinia psidii MF-1]